MALICVPPGGTCGGPLGQSRRIGVTIRLADLPLKEIIDLNNDVALEVIGNALKAEFINRMQEFRDGLSVPIIRSLPESEQVKKPTPIEGEMKNGS